MCIHVVMSNQYMILSISLYICAFELLKIKLKKTTLGWYFHWYTPSVCSRILLLSLIYPISGISTSFLRKSFKLGEEKKQIMCIHIFGNSMVLWHQTFFPCFRQINFDWRICTHVNIKCICERKNTVFSFFLRIWKKDSWFSK